MKNYIKLDHVEVAWKEITRLSKEAYLYNPIWDIIDMKRKQIDSNYSKEQFDDIYDNPDRIITIVEINWEYGYEKQIKRAISLISEYFSGSNEKDNKESISGETVIICPPYNTSTNTDIDDDEEFMCINPDIISDVDGSCYQISNYGNVLSPDGELVTPIYYNDGPRVKLRDKDGNYKYISVIGIMNNMFEATLLTDNKTEKMLDDDQTAKIIFTSIEKSKFSDVGKFCNKNCKFIYNDGIGAFIIKTKKEMEEGL